MCYLKCNCFKNDWFYVFKRKTSNWHLATRMSFYEFKIISLMSFSIWISELLSLSKNSTLFLCFNTNDSLPEIMKNHVKTPTISDLYSSWTRCISYSKNLKHALNLLVITPRSPKSWKGEKIHLYWTYVWIPEPIIRQIHSQWSRVLEGHSTPKRSTNEIIWPSSS